VLNLFLFAVLCLSWGSTWVAIKVGVDEAPPLWFAGSRFVVAGVLILSLAALIDGRGSLKVNRRDAAQLAWVSALVIAVCFALIFWGEQYVSASLTAIVVQGMIPIFLPLFSVILLRDRLPAAKILSIGIGIAGLVIVFLPSVRASLSAGGAGRGNLLTLAGLTAIVIGTLSYCYGSVQSKPILARHSAVAVSGWQNVIGGVLVLAAALMFEAGAAEIGTEVSGLSARVFYAWLWLVVAGSVVGFVLYIVLLKSWGASKLSPYAFVTPIVAIGIEYLLYGRLINRSEAAGMAALFIAVYLALRNPDSARIKKKQND